VRLSLPYPFTLSRRLRPCIRIDGVEITIHAASRSRYVAAIDFGDEQHVNDDLACDRVGATVVDAFLAFLAFLEGAGEGDPEVVDAFPDRVADWAADHVDEIGVSIAEILQFCCEGESLCG